ncbi:MAG: 50S ribosomal protein L17 [Myxococcales bacterium]|nr:50S ribosomal protein L17 [Myxococcales bacterium]
MRHRKSGRKFGMDGSARKAMFRNMVTSLMLHGQIKTTEARAKELRKHAERLITIGKRAPSESDLSGLSGDDLQQARARRVSAIRRIRQVVMDDDVVKLVMGEYAERFRTRSGGYTRVLKLGRPRPGDNARMAVIALVTEAVGEGRKRERHVPETAEVAPPVATAQSAEE